MKISDLMWELDILIRQRDAFEVLYAETGNGDCVSIIRRKEKEIDLLANILWGFFE